MNLRTVINRGTALGISTALVAGVLVGATGTAAHARLWEASNTYTCDFGGLASGDIEAAVGVEIPLSRYSAFTPVPGGIVPVTVTATLPANVATALAAKQVAGVASEDFGISLGASTVPAPVAGELVTEAGTTTWAAEGGNVEFTTGDVGLVNGFLPEEFGLAVTGADGATLGEGGCTLADPEPAQIITGFTLGPQSSATTAPSAVTAKKGKKVVLAVSVRSTTVDEPVSGGSVVAKLGSKTLGTADLVGGKAKLGLGKLPVGKHKVTVTYLGIPSVLSSTARTTVTVK